MSTASLYDFPVLGSRSVPGSGAKIWENAISEDVMGRKERARTRRRVYQASANRCLCQEGEPQPE